MTLRYAVGATPFGDIVVAVTERGLRVAHFVDGDPEILLRNVVPGALLTPAPDELGPTLDRVRRSLDQPEPAPPLDTPGSPFAQRVWGALRTIPYGQTRTYAEVAANLGAPTAARAVARACAVNPVAIVIPCHRVVRADGDLAGYRWGRERKAALLAHERAVVARLRPPRGGSERSAPTASIVSGADEGS
ncbi:MAG: methylated-DNA--[protein]-cysteine S-methyltransferase [Dehalococcoidia bacterium]|nr:methylated-DNA--[protein]-cysteine S-methyltransferase [Dehalococcoidia bacterium]